MIRLSGFADEISSDLNEQISVLQSENIHYLDLRSVWGTNVLDLTDQQIAEIKATLQSVGIGVAAIGSPVGKVPVDFPFEGHMQQFERALTVAKMFETSYIRLFSFYPPLLLGTDHPVPDPSVYREDVLRFLRTMTIRAAEEGVTLIHENEKAIYGDTIARNVDLFQALNDPHFRSVLDPANYLQCEQIPYPDAYEATRPWLEYIHVKDVRVDGTLVVAGEGESNWLALLQRLRADGYDGFLSLEPHLSAAGQYQGFSGPDLFRQASQALQSLLRQIDWEYA